MQLSIFKNGQLVESAPLSSIVNMIRGDAYKELLEELLYLQTSGKREEFKALYRTLPHFTPSGEFKDKCRVERLRTYSGLIMLDVVQVPTDYMPQVRELIEADPMTHICYATLQNTGFKIMVKTDATIKNHRAVYADLRKYYLAKLDDFYLDIDPDGDAVEKLTMLTHDKYIFVNDDSEKHIYHPLSINAVSGNKNGGSFAEPLFFSADALLSIELPEVQCLWQPFFQQIGMGAVIGSSDGGKSAFCRQLAISIALGQKQFLGFSLKSAFGRAIFVSSEDDAQATNMILKKQIRAFSAKTEAMKNLRFLFNTQNLIETLDQELLKSPADLVVLDAFGDIFTGKEMNSISQIRNYLNAFSQLAQRHKCFFLFIHHVGKRTDALEPSKHNAIGSQAFEAKMRVVLELRTTEADLQAKNLYVTKGNYLPSSVKKAVYQLAFDEDTLTFELTNALENRPLSKTADKPRQKYDVDWDLIFDDDYELPHSEIVTRLFDTFGIPKTTAKRYIREHLILSERENSWCLAED